MREILAKSRSSIVLTFHRTTDNQRRLDNYRASYRFLLEASQLGGFSYSLNAALMPLAEREAIGQSGGQRPRK